MPPRPLSSSPKASSKPISTPSSPSLSPSSHSHVRLAGPSPASASLNHTLAGPALAPSPALSPSSSSSRRSSPEQEQDRAEALLDMAIALVDSALDMLYRHIRTDGQLRQDSVLLPGGSVGKHLRHVIETYHAFLLPLQPSSPTPPPGPLEINYDAILPSTRHPIARSLPVCTEAMTTIRDDLRKWGERAGTAGETGSGTGTGMGGGLAEELRREVRLVAITPTRQEMKSTIGRELWFCSLHAIHHFSMLRTIAVHELGIDLPVEFGTAPSTLLYRERNKASTVGGKGSKTQAPAVRSKL
ncbi:hypothetical protein EHS25_000444 [Saitozyma podzolica]|uniref:DinB-like domain-containing protein n=1 Tax=Saitozyma podzolica TaxID=1890683 RepID=A0A427YW93_9TREE|nr:hypothetical protein EHS25_000444 [Saitozyma podzolica]